MGQACCFEGLAAMRAGPRPQPEVRLPASSYVQVGARSAVLYRHGGATRLRQTYEKPTHRLGKGSFGTVVKTTSKATGTACVLKTVDKRAHSEDLESLANEIAIHEVCDHPCIVRLYESFESASHIHMVLEACEGGEVYELLEERGTLREVEALPIIQQVLQAVFYLHEVKRVAHRDLKLENLLLKRRGVPLAENAVKVIDLGFAASFTPGERSFSLLCGTPVYMAPEMARGGYDEKCDCWSSGIMLFELLRGDVPFQGTTARQILRDAASTPLPLVGVSAAVRALLGGLCEKEPEARLSAQEALRSPCFEGAGCTSHGSPQERGRWGSLAENLRSFSELDDFQKAALRLVAYRLEDKDIAEQKAAFERLDRDGDGRLTPQELHDGCAELGLSAEEARGLFPSLDVDGSGCLEFSEFIGATVRKDSLPHHACWEAFRFCDADGSGSISAAEARELLRCQAPASPTEGLPGEAEMDFKAFAAMLRGGRAGGA